MGASVTEDMDRVLARLQALEDERAILHNLYRYGQSIDAGDEVAWLDCFTDDATFLADGRRPTDIAFSVTGRDALKELISGHTSGVRTCSVSISWSSPS